jgi:hypothetical protein
MNDGNVNHTKKRAPEIGAIVLVGIVIAALAFAIPPDRMTDPAVKLLSALIWPYFLLAIVVAFRPQVEELFRQIAERIRSGGGVEIGWVKLPEVAKAAELLPTPTDQQPVTLANVALLHTSRLSKTATELKRDGRLYYRFEVIVIAPNEVMSRIESVSYFLEDAWPPDRRSPTTDDRDSRFKLTDLANGTSIVRASIRLRGQKDPLQLNRFIDLRPDGPPL